MQYILGHRFIDVLGSLSKVFSIQPSTKYEELISHSSRELDLKAWARTAEQMSLAVKTFEQLEPHTVEAIKCFSKLPQEQTHKYEKFRNLERRIDELERASRAFERRVKELDRIRDSGCYIEHGKSSRQRATID